MTDAKSMGIPRNMDDLNSENRPWLSPSDALTRFDPPPVAGRSASYRSRVRYGFRVGGIGLLIGPDTVSELIEQVPVYAVPNTPLWLRGLCNLRGNLVPVYDMRILLEVDEEGEPQVQKLLILDKGEQAVGVLIDELPRALDSTGEATRMPPLPAVLEEYVKEAYAEDGAIWLEFDHQGFFRSVASRGSSH